MAIPVGALIWAALGTGAAVRALWHPQRAVIRDGYASRCAGQDCSSPAMVIEAYEGTQPFYAMVTGVVLSVAGPVVEVASEAEPVVVRYEAELGSVVQVQAGQRVRIGQQLGMARRLGFAVRQAVRQASGVSWAWLEPASWLVTRGLGISVRRNTRSAIGAANWCEAGRKLVVPQKIAQCGFELPQPTGYMLLPVSVTLS